MNTIDRRTLVTFRSRTAGKDSFGQATETFSDLKTMYAAVDYEQADGDGYERDIMQSKIKITCRPVPGLTTENRAVVDGKNYDITNIRYKSRIWLEIDATQITD
jgi:head-tail adaptor